MVDIWNTKNSYQHKEKENVKRNQEYWLCMTIDWTHYYVSVGSISLEVLNNNFTRLPIEMQEMNWGKLVEEVRHYSWNINLGSHISFA